jgi:hypothetical protein
VTTIIETMLKSVSGKKRGTVMTKNGEERNVKVRLDRVTIEKAKIIAARRSTSLGELMARRIEVIFGEEESYERAERQARKLFERGFHLGVECELV